MKSKFSKKLELVTNAAIILAVAVLGYFLFQKYFSAEGAPPVRPEIVRGTKISLAGINWAQNRRTLLLVLQKNCPGCSNSMPFYKTLVEKSKGKEIQLVAVLPDSREEGIQYLKENGVEIREIRQVRRDELNEVSVTPTLILIDERGEVLISWTGKLPSEKEKEVTDNL